MKIIAWINLLTVSIQSLVQIYTGVEERKGSSVVGAIVGVGITLPLCGRILGWW